MKKEKIHEKRNGSIGNCVKTLPIQQSLKKMFLAFTFKTKCWGWDFSLLNLQNIPSNLISKMSPVDGFFFVLPDHKQ